MSLFAAEQLISVLTDVGCADRDIRRGLVALRRTLVKERDAGTPWRARDAAEILARLDLTVWISVLGLLDLRRAAEVPSRELGGQARIALYIPRHALADCFVERATSVRSTAQQS